MFEKHDTVQDALADGARRRRAVFESVDEFYNRMRERAPFRLLSDDALYLFAEASLRAVDGGFELACPPAFEGQGFADNIDTEVWKQLDNVEAEILVMSGNSNDMRAQVANELAALGQFDYLRLDRTSHLLPMEVPGRLARIALAYFELN